MRMTKEKREREKEEKKVNERGGRQESTRFLNQVKTVKEIKVEERKET